MTRGKETACTTNLIKDIFAAGGWAYKIPDPTPGGYKTNKRPFDVCGHFYGNFFAIEVKFLPRYGPFGPNKLADHQHKALRHVSERGGLSFVVLFVNSHNENRLFWWPYTTFANQKTIRHEQLIELPYLSNRKGGYPLDWLSEACRGK